ncbi:MAG TPA: YegS/Rv2252/BmrU family lipid kinase [Candidatus Coprocola pullicola]|nr:YegS/Rv2252/BmrU family lipid kinase [Candidatus Coprocola pullicola]
MKKCKLIYNPYSGSKTFKFDLDICIFVFQKAGYEVHIFRTIKSGDIREHILTMDMDYDLIVVSGGDGTINIVVNAMMERNMDVPLGVIPSGTANDFATFLGLKTGNVEECCNVITTEKPKKIDIGIVNEQYFINVCAGGLFTNVSQNVDKDLKHALGSLSYYIKGIEQLTNFKKIPFRITTEQEVVEEDLYLFLVLNSAGTGGFNHIAPSASITDGMFDFVGIKAKPVIELPKLFFKIFNGEFVKDSGVLYLKRKQFQIECLDIENLQFHETTVDGELGPAMPLNITVIPRKLAIFGKF